MMEDTVIVSAQEALQVFLAFVDSIRKTNVTAPRKANHLASLVRVQTLLVLDLGCVARSLRPADTVARLRWLRMEKTDSASA